MPLVRELIVREKQLNPAVKYQLYFVETNPQGTKVNGHPLVSESEFFALKCDERYFNVAIADSKARQQIAAACIAQGAKPMSIQSSMSVSYDGNLIGDGAILCANTMVTSNARIGRFFQCNIYSYVAHDCVIGDFVTFAPSVHCNGNVHIRDHAYIGTGAVIKQGSSSKPIVIGEGAILGMGAVVTRDVAPFTTVVGSPAKPLQKE
jgi:sugar O-acyltransferase (sialic acid O-acetyltransferase NeuD family)